MRRLRHVGMGVIAVMTDDEYNKMKKFEFKLFLICIPTVISLGLIAYWIFK